MRKLATLIFFIAFVYGGLVYGQTAKPNPKSRESRTWVNMVKGGNALNEFGDSYSFQTNGDIIVKDTESNTFTAKFFGANDTNKAYYYETVSLKELLGESASDVPVQIITGYMMDGKSLKYAVYTENYVQKESDWRTQNGVTENETWTPNSNVDYKTYPVPNMEDIDFSETVVIGELTR